MKIGIQGELGAYSHIAVENLYKDADIKTCSTFEDTFKLAFNDPSIKIVIPIENSLAGRVADIHYFYQNINYKFMVNIFFQLNIIYLENKMLQLKILNMLEVMHKLLVSAKKLLMKEILNQLFL